ncbi:MULTISPECIES: hypothetical protein [Flavobacterium]|uniref:Signal peptidase n=1 Tax=Flavobacterium panici TaxID=2654843 RepID=A0A9N8IZH8_9FLAO|nr:MULTISPECIES: hypothetical protein [Flavobacterium]CAC9973445.1 hypothetical protein FLAPXU55_01128 [Flavobacterium panici]
MKIRNILLALFLIVSSVSVTFADNTPPPPPQAAKTSGTASTTDDDDITPPGLPINDHIPYLIAAGFVLGMTIIYRNKIKKASI